MTRRLNAARRRIDADQRPRALSVDPRRIVDASAIRLNMIRNLPLPALLLDRIGNVRFVNVQALALIGHGATDNLLSQYFVEDAAGIRHTDRFAAMPTRLATPQAVNVSGWMRLADARWVAVELRLERVAGMRFGNLDAEEIAVINLRPHVSLSADHAGLSVN